MRADAEFFGEVPDYHQKLVPIVKVESDAARFFCNGIHSIQNLPHAYVDHPVTAGL
jgi:hypothetical protein